MNEIHEYLVCAWGSYRVCSVCGTRLPAGHNFKILYTQIAPAMMHVLYNVCPYREDCHTTARVWLSLGHTTGTYHE